MRTRQFIKNIVNRFFLSSASLIISLVSVPFIIKWLGSEKFGAVKTLTDWFGYFGLLEVGISATFLPKLTQSIANKEHHVTEDTIFEMMKSYLYISLICLFIGLLFAINIQNFIPVNPNLILDLKQATFIGLIQFIFLIFIPMKLLIDALQLGYLLHWIVFIQFLIITATSCLFAYLQWGIRGQIFSIIFGVFFSTLVIFILVTKKYPIFLKYPFKILNFKKMNIFKPWKINKDAFIIDVSGRVAVYSDNIIIGALLGPLQVVSFFITQRLSQIILVQLQGIGNASWAGLSELYFKEDKQLFNQRLIELTKLTSIIGVAFLAPISVYNQNFIGLWVGSDKYAGLEITILSSLNVLLNATTSLWGWCFATTGNFSRLSKVWPIWAIINFLISFFMTKYYGISGPLWGTFITYLAIPLWYMPYQMKKMFNISFLGLLKAFFIPTLTAIPYGIILNFFNNNSQIGWFELVVKLAVSFLLFILLWFIFGLSKLEKTEWLKKIKIKKKT